MLLLFQFFDDGNIHRLFVCSVEMKGSDMAPVPTHVIGKQAWVGWPYGFAKCIPIMNCDLISLSVYLIFSSSRFNSFRPSENGSRQRVGIINRNYTVSTWKARHQGWCPFEQHTTFARSPCSSLWSPLRPQMKQMLSFAFDLCMSCIKSSHAQPLRILV